eukprot:g3889.t1
MRAIYFNFGVETIRSVKSTAPTGIEDGDVMETSSEEVANQNRVWALNPTFSNCPEIAQLKRKMNLPMWWRQIDISEFHDDNVEELQLLASQDLAPNLAIARVGGRIVPQPTKYTIRLANHKHLHMKDGGSSDSVFSFINHSFRPNVRCIPVPADGYVIFETLRRISKGEPLSFDYTSTEEPVFAAPFVDLESGKSVG